MLLGLSNHKNEMGGVCGTHEGGFWWGDLGKKKIPLGSQSKSKFVPVNVTKAHTESQATGALTSASDTYT